MFACKDVSVVRGRGDSDVVRPVVAPVVPGTHQGCVGDAGKGIPGSGMPGGGEERCSSSSSHKTKPNRVKGGLLARVQMWEMKTQLSRDEKCTLYSTAVSPRPELSDRQEMDRS